MSSSLRVFPGESYPRGATYKGRGVNFSLFSEHATSVEVCLFDTPHDAIPSASLQLREQTALTWHGFIRGLKPGQLYLYRVDGPYDPLNGHRFNKQKYLLDPYAKAITGDVKWDDALFSYVVGSEDEDLSFDTRESAEFMPKCVIIDPRFDWKGDKPPRTPWNQTIIYEAHVKGLTKLHMDVPELKRGTYAGLASEPVIKHLQSLGISAIELLPIQQHVNDRALLERGLTNYWGYNTIGFFAPDFRYSSSGSAGEQVNEFREMVRKLHKAGIEVILDVVYNHTAEGSHLGPTLCFRGIDNASYYNLSPENPRFGMDFSGCGGSFNMRHPRVLQFIMDSLRYWVTEMHVDGFRFDLAATLAREFFEVDKLSTFFDIIAQDPVLSLVKLIAEPWDLGPGGYQVGNFPHLWTEWNGKYRDTIRKFWKGENGQLSDLGYRLTGSSDLYESENRKPFASINFITCHDGFTLRDLVSYQEKHNENNGEENRDGSNDNHSWNCGIEGPADEIEITTLRIRQMKNLIATLLLSQGVPMLLAGDELGKSNNGNNNTYCQDNETTWIDWNFSAEAIDLLEFFKLVIQIRKTHPTFHRKKFFKGKTLFGGQARDLHWIRPDGKEMNDDDWSIEWTRSLGLLIPGGGIDDVNKYGKRIIDDTFYLVINAHHDTIDFQLPYSKVPWTLLFDTASKNTGNRLTGTAHYTMQARAFALFCKLRRGQTYPHRSDIRSSI
ncbi:MAG: glycogen debranching protein GlgX [Fibrobacter sp.]|mgnify:CR=1 FL=1|nr:glycogen debranching protein GlgX [Fibrobacter sp.]